MSTATETPNLNLDAIFEEERAKVVQEKLEGKRRENEENSREVAREQKRAEEVLRMLFKLNEALHRAIVHSGKVRETISALGNTLFCTSIVRGYGLVLLEISLPEPNVVKLCVANDKTGRPFIAFYVGTYRYENAYYQLKDNGLHLVPEQADEELAALTEQGELVRAIARKSYQP